ncbi:hypothetical protein LTR37_012039 [Vermiconidia calcicola]|uniref:Uncharacterized protein n=1 Tax=Vermiconidia calcicola TaxID=1690605 RepID=A0ACC3N344_9PEZI|nr:hypothetical protein LTR37_012039 [Vermiconidia calcicola]
MSDIDFTDFDGTALQELPAQDAVFQTMKTLRKIIYLTTDGYSATTGGYPDINAIPRVIAAVERLEDLQHGDNAVSFGLGAQLLLANTLSHLRIPELISVRLPDFQTLFEALRRCHGTVERIFFYELTVHSKSHQWAQVLDYLRTIPYLRDLIMNCVYHEGDVLDLVVCVRDAEDFTVSSELSVDVTGKENIDATLAGLIERGIVLEIRGV